MGCFSGPDGVENGLVLALDAGNTKSYDGNENLVSYSTYFASTWSNIFPANATLTTGITAPDGTNTAVRLTCATTGNSLFRVSFPSFTPNGTDTYTTSFYVRLISGDTSLTFGNQLRTDLADGTPSGNYLPSLITNTWVRVSFTGVPTATTKSFIDLSSDNNNNYVLDFWGVQIERGSTANPYYPTTGTSKTRGTTWTDLSGTNHLTLSNVSYVSGTTPYFDFNGTSSYAYNFSANSVLSTGNTATVLVWIYPATTQPDANYSGMFVLGTKGCALGNGNGQSLLFSMQSNRTLTMAKWCDDSFSSIAPTANTWSMVSLVKNGAATRFGINATTFNDAANTGTQNFAGDDLTVGCTDNPGRYYQGRIGAVYLFNRALSDLEIQQNYNATKSRYGR